MMLVRFKQTYRERAIEWWLSSGLAFWGLLVIASPQLFTWQPFFHPLLTITSQTVWGISALIVGLLRLTFLVINGAWRPSAHIRAIGCVFGCLVWGVLAMATLQLAWITPTFALYAILFVLDLQSLWFSAGDAKLADIAARK